MKNTYLTHTNFSQQLGSVQHGENASGHEYKLTEWDSLESIDYHVHQFGCVRDGYYGNNTGIWQQKGLIHRVISEKFPTGHQ